MTNLRYAGILGRLFEANDLQAQLGCSADEAFAMIDAADAVASEHAEQPVTIGNVIYGVDFAMNRRKGETIGAL